MEGVGAQDHAARERDPLARQSVRIAAAVPVLVRVADDRRDLGHLGHRAQDPLADHRVLADDGPLVLGQRARLVEDRSTESRPCRRRGAVRPRAAAGARGRRSRACGRLPRTASARRPSARPSRCRAPRASRPRAPSPRAARSRARAPRRACTRSPGEVRPATATRLRPDRFASRSAASARSSATQGSTGPSSSATPHETVIAGSRAVLRGDLARTRSASSLASPFWVSASSDELLAAVAEREPRRTERGAHDRRRALQHGVADVVRRSARLTSLSRSKSSITTASGREGEHDLRAAAQLAPERALVAQAGELVDGALGIRALVAAPVPGKPPEEVPSVAHLDCLFLDHPSAPSTRFAFLSSSYIRHNRARTLGSGRCWRRCEGLRLSC